MKIASTKGMAQSSQSTPLAGVRFNPVDSQGRSITDRYGKKAMHSRRYTPYQKTPRTRDLRTTLKHAKAPVTRNTRTPPRTRQDKAPIIDLVNKTWRVYRVSPLYQFSYLAADLKKYSRQLSRHIDVEGRKGVAVASDTDKTNSACFSLYKGLRSTKADREAIQITLSQKSNNVTDNGELRVALTAVLCSVDCREDVTRAVVGPFSMLPIMLIKGSLGLTSQLIPWLQTQFDCKIDLAKFSPTCLSWMVSMWAGYTPEKGGRAVELCYSVPKEVEGLSTITMTVNPKRCKNLWDSLHEETNQSFSEDEVVNFIKSLETHFYHHFKVNLTAMSLTKVGTSTAYIGSDGRLKIFSADRLHQVLAHVTETVIEQNLSFSSI